MRVREFVSHRETSCVAVKYVYQSNRIIIAELNELSLFFYEECVRKEIPPDRDRSSLPKNSGEAKGKPIDERETGPDIFFEELGGGSPCFPLSDGAV